MTRPLVRRRFPLECAVIAIIVSAVCLAVSHVDDPHDGQRMVRTNSGWKLVDRDLQGVELFKAVNGID